MGIQVIIGEDDFLVAEAARQALGDVAEVERVDSINSGNEESRLCDLAAARQSLRTPPFLEPSKGTWWRNVGFLPGAKKGGKGEGEGEDKVSEAVKRALEDFAEELARTQLPENQQFVLSGPRLLATSVFAKRLKAGKVKLTVFATDPRLVLEQARARMLAAAKARGLAFKDKAFEHFLATAGTDTRTLNSELEKLDVYLGPQRREVTEADVAAVVSAGPTAGAAPTPWEVTDAVGARNAAAVGAALEKYRGVKSMDILLTIACEGLFRQLCILKDAQARGTLSTVESLVLPFNLRKYLGFLPRWTLRELRLARGRFLQLREAVVSGTAAGEARVEIEILRTLAGAS